MSRSLRAPPRGLTGIMRDAAKEGVDFSVSDGAGAVAEVARSGRAAAFPRRTRRKGLADFRHCDIDDASSSGRRPQSRALRARARRAFCADIGWRFRRAEPRRARFF